MKKILFVCMGNICRSPTAEGVFLKLLAEHNMQGKVHVGSAGTHDYHVDSPPDARAIEHAARRGYDLKPLRGRQISPSDFETYDYILVMDKINMRHLKSICATHNQEKIELLLDYGDSYQGEDVPDPYQGGAEDFERVLDMIEDGCNGLLKFLRARDRSRN